MESFALLEGFAETFLKEEALLAKQRLVEIEEFAFFANKYLDDRGRAVAGCGLGKHQVKGKGTNLAIVAGSPSLWSSEAMKAKEEIGSESVD